VDGVYGTATEAAVNAFNGGRPSAEQRCRPEPVERFRRRLLERRERGRGQRGCVRRVDARRLRGRQAQRDPRRGGGAVRADLAPGRVDVRWVRGGGRQRLLHLEEPRHRARAACERRHRHAVQLHINYTTSATFRAPTRSPTRRRPATIRAALAGACAGPARPAPTGLGRTSRSCVLPSLRLRGEGAVFLVRDHVLSADASCGFAYDEANALSAREFALHVGERDEEVLAIASCVDDPHEPEAV
jgi:hypothetical protein